MELTVLGSGGCSVIPKPLCTCPLCQEARKKGGAYKRTGPSVFLHDANLLIDTPAEISCQLNRSGIKHLDYLMFTHFDPDHVEGFRVVEQIALDYRTWKAYPDKTIKLLLPEILNRRIGRLQSTHGPQINFFQRSGFIERIPFQHTIPIGDIKATAVRVNRKDGISFIYVFKKKAKKLVYAPCDIKPFPAETPEVQKADLLVIQPGLFKDGLKHDFTYPSNHISKKTLYTFEETLSLAQRIESEKILFVHLEEHWNRSYDDYHALEKKYENIHFAYDGLKVSI